MYKVLLVDDEILILNGLKSIIEWESLGLAITSTALNGEEALVNYIENPVDIVITDITMPKMDGLELIEKIKKINERVKFIILSGYDDFVYAKKAISLGIENYILKPINEEELEATLNNVVKKLEANSNNILIDEKKLEILKENILYRWACNTISSYELEERADILGINLNCLYYTVIVIKQNSNKNCVDKFNEAYKFIKKQCGKNLYYEVFRDLENDIVCIIGGIEFDELKSESERFSEEILSVLSDNIQMESLITIGTIENDYRNVFNSYSESKKLQNYILVSGYNKVVSYYDFSNSSRQKNLNKIDIHEFNKVFLNKDVKLIHDYIDDTFDKLLKSENIKPADIQNMAINMIFMINTVSKDLNVTNEEDEDIKQLISQILKFSTVEDIKCSLKSKISKIIDEIHKNAGELSPIIRQVLSYINNNYKQEISLKTLSQKFNINPSYLGQVFHKEVGEQFSDYLNKIRNEKAKELLLNTNLKVNDIAAELGYIDTSYFYRKFKDYFGISPNAMRGSKNYKL